MDNLVAVFKTQYIFYLRTPAAFDFLKVFGTVIGQSGSNRAAGFIDTLHRRPHPELTAHRQDSGRQQTLAAFLQCPACSGIKNQIALRPQNIGDPVFSALHLLRTGQEKSPDLFSSK